MIKESELCGVLIKLETLNVKKGNALFKIYEFLKFLLAFSSIWSQSVFFMFYTSVFHTFKEIKTKQSIN